MSSSAPKSVRPETAARQSTAREGAFMPITSRRSGADRELSPRHISSGSAENLIETILPLKKDVDAAAVGTLYIGYASELPAQCPVNVFCVGDAPVPKASGSCSMSTSPFSEGYGPQRALRPPVQLHAGQRPRPDAAADLLASLARRGAGEHRRHRAQVPGKPIIVSDKSWKALAIASDVKRRTISPGTSL
jgi:hypothetical protein